MIDDGAPMILVQTGGWEGWEGGLMGGWGARLGRVVTIPRSIDMVWQTMIFLDWLVGVVLVEKDSTSFVVRSGDAGWDLETIEH